MDYEDFNSTILPFSEEAGMLGEQNWSSASGTGSILRADLDVGVGLAFAHTYVKSDCADSVNFPLGTEATLASTSTWTEIEGMSVEFTSTGEALYILASMQESTGTGVLTSTNLVWVKFGITLDGAILPELTVGDQDTGPEGPVMEVGVSGYGQGVDIDGMVRVTPGYHRVAVVAFATHVEGAGTSTLDIQICNRELLVMEIW